MKHRRSLALLGVTCLLVTSATTPRAWSRGPVASCPALVRSALDTTGELCDGTGRNEACYGNILVEADARADVANFRFEQRGDIVDVADMQSVRTSPMDLITGEWGVALMRLQALLTSDDPTLNITLVLMGNARLESAAPEGAPAELMTLEVTGTNPRIRSNIRQLPTTSSRVVGKLEPGESIFATGRLIDGSWLRVEMPGGGVGWIYAGLLQSEGSLDALAVVDGSTRAAGPMHAFYFNSGVDDAACPEAPESGLLVQTPEGVAEVTLLINEVDIQLGSTVYFQAEPGVGMGVYVVEGHARVTAEGMTELVPAGAFSTIPINADGHASGPPSDAKPYDVAHVQSLPLVLLERFIQIAPPADDGDDIAGTPIDELEFEDDDILDEGVTTSGEDTSDDGGKPAPKDKDRPGEPDPPADPNPPGNPEPPGSPPPLSDYIPGDDKPGKGDDQRKQKDVMVLYFAV